MSERLQVRTRAGVDDAGNATPAGPASPITARGVEPGASAFVLGLGHNGDQVAYTVYFVPSPPALVDGAPRELFVRGAWYPVRVHDWRSPYNTGRSGVVAVCELGRG